jgi:hypothetical protein
MLQLEKSGNPDSRGEAAGKHSKMAADKLQQTDYTFQAARMAARGQCYDQRFQRFLSIVAIKLAVFSNCTAMIHFCKI